MISVSTEENLEPAANTVELARSVLTEPVPLVVGGAVLSRVENVAEYTGADFSTNDIGAALEVLGLTYGACRALMRA
jgi:hypothetical protein